MATDTKFVVELKGVRLPTAVQKGIEAEIRQVVMREIAKVDLRGDIGIRFPKEWFGIWIKRFNKLPTTGGPR